MMQMTPARRRIAAKANIKGFAGEWVRFVADGDDKDDERDQDSEADSGFVHVQLVLQRLLPSFFLSRPIGLVQTQSDRAENNGKHGNNGHDVDFDGRHFELLFWGGGGGGGGD